MQKVNDYLEWLEAYTWDLEEVKFLRTEKTFNDKYHLTKFLLKLPGTWSNPSYAEYIEHPEQNVFPYLDEYFNRCNMSTYCSKYLETLEQRVRKLHYGNTLNNLIDAALKPYWDIKIIKNPEALVALLKAYKGLNVIHWDCNHRVYEYYRLHPEKVLKYVNAYKEEVTIF